MSRLLAVRHSIVVGGEYFFRMGNLHSVYAAIEQSHIMLPLIVGHDSGRHLDRMAAVLVSKRIREPRNTIRALQSILGLRTTGYCDGRYSFPGCDFGFPFIDKWLPDADGKQFCFRIVTAREDQFRALLDATELALDCEQKEYEETGNDSMFSVARYKYLKIVGPFLESSFQP